jgi:hypothetical protein
MNKNKSKIPKHYRVLKVESDYIRTLLRGYSEPDIRLYNHILQSNIQQYQQHPEGSPIPWSTIQKYLPGAASHRLNPFVEICGYWPGHCRVYRVKDEYLFDYLNISSEMSAEQYLLEPHVCFETGRLMNTPPRSILTDEAHHPYPPQIRAAIKVLMRNGSLANLPAIEAHVQRRETEFNATNVLDNNDDEDSKKAKGRYINDRSCRKAFLGYKPIHQSGDIWFYRPQWYAVSTGRLHVKGGCLQSASGDMKRVAYAGIDGLRNYDIQSSQVYIAVVLLEQAGLDASWLKDYYCRHDYDWYGSQVGIPGKLFKRIVIAICMGAYLPKLNPKMWNEENSILKILGEIAQDEEHLLLLLRLLRDVVGELAAVLKDWHRYLLTDYVPANKVGGYLRNAVGMNLALYDLKFFHRREKWRGASRIAGHLLQGLEAACIHEMIARSDEAGFRPISCEHDGFIVSFGEPDAAMWDEITARHGLAGMQLVNKEL